jgi:hypothetical protein
MSAAAAFRPRPELPPVVCVLECADGQRLSARAAVLHTSDTQGEGERRERASERVSERERERGGNEERERERERKKREGRKEREKKRGGGETKGPPDRAVRGVSAQDPGVRGDKPSSFGDASFPLWLPPALFASPRAPGDTAAVPFPALPDEPD